MVLAAMPWTIKKNHRGKLEIPLRNERMFGLLNENRRASSRYDKLDSTFISFWYLALIAIALRDRSFNKA